MSAAVESAITPTHAPGPDEAPAERPLASAAACPSCDALVEVRLHYRSDRDASPFGAHAPNGCTACGARYDTAARFTVGCLALEAAWRADGTWAHRNRPRYQGD